MSRELNQASKMVDVLLGMLKPGERKRARSLARNIFEVIDLEDTKIAYIATQLAIVRRAKRDEKKSTKRKAVKS